MGDLDEAIEPSQRIEISTVRKVEVTPRLLAELWWAMDDDGQARFFCHVASFAEGRLADQGYYIGSHLATCACSTQEGRDLIDEIHRQMHADEQPHAEAHGG